MDQKTARRFLRNIANSLTGLVLLCAALSVWANYKRNILPPESALVSAIEQEPAQKSNAGRAFSLSWRGAEYQLYPMADYEITGLVVTRNDIGGFSDIYHTNNSVDVLDVCLIWGDNTTEEVYRNVAFWSEPFACFVQPKNQTGSNAFDWNALSNTHLLARDELLAKELNRIRLGDQIRLRGKLVNYHPVGASEQLRRSSLVREDRGNGACEVLYVEDFTVLKLGNPLWNDIFDIARAVGCLALILKIVSLLLFPYLEYRLM